MRERRVGGVGVGVGVFCVTSFETCWWSFRVCRGVADFSCSSWELGLWSGRKYWNDAVGGVLKFVQRCRRQCFMLSEFRSFFFHHNLRNESQPTINQEDRLALAREDRYTLHKTPWPPSSPTQTHGDARGHISPKASSNALPCHCPRNCSRPLAILTGPVEHSVLHRMPVSYRPAAPSQGWERGTRFRIPFSALPSPERTHQHALKTSAVGKNPGYIE